MPLVTVTDSFNRANTSAGTMGSTDGGATLAWQNPTSWYISGNTATNSTTTKDPIWIVNNQADVTVSMTTEGGNGVGPAFWVQNSSNFWVAYLYSNRYSASTTYYTCPPCAETASTSCAVCGDCTTNPTTYTGSRVSNTGSNATGACANTAVGSCTGSCGGCTSTLDINLGSYVSARTGACTTRTIQNRNCATTNSCGNLNTATNSCGSTCSTSAPFRSCGPVVCPGTANCNTTCGYTNFTNRTCYCGCNAVPGTQNTSAGCNTCPSSIANTGCAGSETRREYIFRVSRIASGTETVVYSNTILDTTSSNTTVLAAIKVITAGTDFRAIGYSDAGMTSIYHDTGVDPSGYTDNTTTVGVGLARMALGTATPGLVYSMDSFSAAYVSGGDSVGILQG